MTESKSVDLPLVDAPTVLPYMKTGKQLSRVLGGLASQPARSILRPDRRVTGKNPTGTASGRHKNAAFFWFEQSPKEPATPP